MEVATLFALASALVFSGISVTLALADSLAGSGQLSAGGVLAAGEMADLR
ncbi:hypothetical protein CURE108131_12420 [Cupriavidus respiraculi]|uniref:Uncharacterized protein n=1 Tax=Cupriavidus respiraculi TaxID=195930 RepID=A0ABN7YFC0_9BURK|nr:hypothetical protein [Cupriavidus respiraculi]CAG9171396.1 hypothetical protein LMG21510_01640 [Cupriavidus respiraculi]